MTEEIKTQQSAESTMNEAQCCRAEHKVDTDSNLERPRLQFNRYLFENLMSNLECQQEYWKRKADSQECHLNHNFAVWQGYGLKASSCHSNHKLAKIKA